MLLLGNNQCQNNSSNSSTSPAFVTTLAVEDANGNPTTNFSQGQSIQFVLTVHNRTDTTQTLNMFVCGNSYAFLVLEAETSTPTFSDIGPYPVCKTIGVLSFSFPAGETYNTTYDWNQLDNTGQLVAPGNYEVIAGWICYTDANTNDLDTMDCMSPQFTTEELTPAELRSTLVQFTIQ
jgi:hypothetical protein